ncbi:MAG: hypothetical protein HKP30_05835, partial [Myxococcales bacterium]|nr:hypothetical protein [Myxococcales bacterium]
MAVRPPQRPRCRHWPAWPLLLALLAGIACSTPVGVRRVSERDVHRTLTANVLSTGRLSVASRQVLLRLGLSERYDTEPATALATLHDWTRAEMTADRLFALAELSFHHAERAGERAYFVHTAIYAYAFLFPGADDPSPHPFDPRVRTAVDLYNRALTAALVDDEGKVALTDGAFPLPIGTLELAVDPAGFRWADRRLDHLVPAAELEVRGLRNRYRRPGIGAPFAADALPVKDSTVAIHAARLPQNVKVPVTAFLRLRDVRRSLREGHFFAVLELYSASDRPSIEVNGRTVPLEYETSASLAYGLEDERIWAFEMLGYLGADDVQLEEGLVMVEPYRPGRIPLVLVHGTASTPARWAEMLNELSADPQIRERYQFWFFVYTSGKPILISASELRESLSQTIAILDPDGTDPALSRVVLLGHSQGGLLAKLQVIASGDRFWTNISDRPFDEVAISPKTRAVLARSLFFDPLPFVSRVIFVSTPHRGSYLAGNWLGRLAARLVRAPATLVDVSLELARLGADLARASIDVIQGEEDTQLQRSLARVPSSVDDMDPTQPFIRIIQDIRVDP